MWAVLSAAKRFCTAERRSLTPRPQVGPLRIEYNLVRDRGLNVKIVRPDWLPLPAMRRLEHRLAGYGMAIPNFAQPEQHGVGERALL